MANISVIVPVYKVERFLRRCVDSILAQTYPDFEVILVDDGSPDNCGEICDEYARADSRVHVIHQENGGLSAARNSGIDWVFENSDSRWLSFVDGDDWIHRDFLQVLYRTAEQTLCKISACAFFETSGMAVPENQDTSARKMSAGDYYCESVHGSGTPAACNKLYHISLFKDLRYPVGKLHEDEFTTYRILYDVGHIGVTMAALYAYYQNDEGITHSEWNPRRMDALEAFEQQIAFAREQGDERLLKMTAEQYVFGCYDQIAQAPTIFDKELRKKLRSALKLGRECGAFPRNRNTLWAYEAAYPCKILWWLVSKCNRKAGEGST